MTTIELVALITWILTAGGGFYMLATWLAQHGIRQQPRATHPPPGLLFAHFLLAAAGLVVWITYLIGHQPVLAWAALIILAVGTVGGFAMVARWIPVYSTPYGAVSAPTAGGGTTESEITAAQPQSEWHFPLAVVAAHGLLAAATLVLVLLTALGVGAH